MDSSSATTFVSVISSITGLVGVITGLASVWFTYLNYTRDNVRVKVSAFKNMKTFIQGKGSSKESFLVITAANVGRRPVIIDKAAFISLKAFGGGISSSSMMMGPQELKEGKKVDYMIDEETIDYSDISHVSVYDSVGNEYRYYLAPWYERFFYWLLHVSYVRRKPSQAPKNTK